MLSSRRAFDDSSQRLTPPGPLPRALITMVQAALDLPLAHWLRGFFAPRARIRATEGLGLLDTGCSPQELRRSILGRGKSAVAETFGAPRTAYVGSIPVRARDMFWRADTWYYPLDSRTQTAVVVRFDRGIARAVEFIQPPKIMSKHPET